MTDTEKVWKEMENLGWSNKPKDFHMEYFEDIIKATKMALMTSQKSDSLPCVSESLLAKYIQHVGEAEGIDFIYSCNDGMASDVKFTDEELATLERLR
jgi:hypothetical protein